MNGFDDFLDTLSDATKQLVSDIETAWQELKADLHRLLQKRGQKVLRHIDRNPDHLFG